VCSSDLDEGSVHMHGTVANGGRGGGHRRVNRCARSRWGRVLRVKPPGEKKRKHAGNGT